jgi:polyferredoxin
LLGFFLWAILGMSAAELRSFIDSPYNRVADIKMFLFFERIDVLALSVIGFLAAASVLINGAWCRYLCPYGALLGLASVFSPTKIVRNESACIDCGRCDRACMARLPVSMSQGIGGVECTTCLDCLASCPSPQSLSVRAFSKPIRATGMAAAILLLFMGSYSIARVAGHWHNDIPDSEYIRRVAEIDSPAYSHPGSSLRRGSAGTAPGSEATAAAAPDEDR